jgi:hypothetical protein
LPANSTLKRRLLHAAAFPAFLVGMVFLINVFSYSGDWWFQWPSLGFFALFALRAIWMLKREG